LRHIGEHCSRNGTQAVGSTLAKVSNISRELVANLDATPGPDQKDQLDVVARLLSALLHLSYRGLESTRSGKRSLALYSQRWPA
jgi:hypothetical protein